MAKEKTKIGQKLELDAQKRIKIGGGLNALRKSGLLPAVLYGKKQDAISLQIPLKDFEYIFQSAGESTLIYINVNGQSFPTIIHDVSRDPVTDKLLHADFYKVSLTEKIKTMVPVVFEGESPAVKDLKAIFVRNVNELEVEAFPQDLPHEIKVDISGLNNFGDRVLVRDLKLGDKIKVLAEDEEIIATVQEPMSEEELKASLEEPIAAIEEVEVIEKEKKEGESAAEEAPAKEEPAKPEK